MPRVFISVGSNLDPENNVLATLRLLQQHVSVTAVSTLYRTPAWERPEQPDFINGVVEATTDHPPHILKWQVLRAIETALGRERSEDKDAPRPIDLDLLLYGNVQLIMDDLRLPDLELIRRPFLLYPLYELAPDLVLPDSGEPLAQVIARVPQEMMQPLVEYTERVRKEIDYEPRTRGATGS